MAKLICKQSEAITVATSKTMSLYGKLARKHGLNYNSLMVLYAMEGTESCTQKDICEKWMLPKTTVCNILSDFRQKGYVIFLEESDDKREKKIQLTEAGKAFSQSILENLHQTEYRAMHKMGPTICKQLVDGTVLFSKLFETEVEGDGKSGHQH